jgi:hypothetical protein
MHADARHRGIPPGLDDMEPGPELAAWLSAIDVEELSGHDRIILLRAHQRLVSHFRAKVVPWRPPTRPHAPHATG